MKLSSPAFPAKFLPIILVLPQLLITFIFFIFPAASALKGAFEWGDAFGLHKAFAGLDNFHTLFQNPHYLNSMFVTFEFSTLVALLSLTAGLFFALLVDRVHKGKAVYKTLFLWPYAVAPAVAGMLWRFLFDPAIGICSFILEHLGYHWNFNLNGNQAMFLVVIASTWQQLSYNFLFFLAGLQAIPQTLLEAAALDGAGPFRRFWHITFPLLSPITFFLFVLNLIYAFFDTFGVIDTLTQGGPGEATNILVYKVYHDGFVGLDMGSSNAQSVILMLLVIGLTIIQFRYLESKVHY